MEREISNLLVLFFTIILVSHIISAEVYINEVELNPAGSDGGNEWIEIYNSGEEVNLDGWYITDRDDNEFFFPEEIIGTNGFFVLDGINGLVNTNERLKLFDFDYVMQDDSGNLSDSQDNNKTHQRVPDGTGAFVFQNSTKGITNIINITIIPIIITNKTSSPSCLFFDNTITLGVDVNGSCIQEVIFSVDVNGNWTNFTGIEITPGHYFVILPSGTFSSDGNFDWTVYARNCVNDIEKDGTETLVLNGKTSLSVNPSSPNGLNNWYVSEPEFTLNNPDASDIWYQWDSDDVLLYTGTFGLENIPNAPPIESAGIQELRWFSDVCSIERGINESKSTEIFKVDLTNPVIKDLMPEPDSAIPESLIDISAYIDEVYQSNSGVNLSSVVMEIDDISAPASVQVQDSLDAKVNYTANLSAGIHNVTVSVFDNAGRFSERTWEFEVVEIKEFDLNVYSPENIIYEKKRVLLNLTTTDNESNLTDVEKIEYINYNDKKPKWKTLCKDCDEYIKERNMNEGQNNITIRASIDGAVKEANVSFFIDSKKPIIHSMLPKKKSVTNGSMFWIKYSEDNLEKVELFFNGSSVLNCTSGRRQECSTSINLSGHDGESIEYWFEVSDSINTVITKKVNVTVDTTSPVLTINMPQNATYGKKVPFNISVSEKTDIEYLDSWDVNPQWKKVCSSCNSFGLDKIKTKSFKKGIHELVIKATDDAGNSDEGNVGFFVNY